MRVILIVVLLLLLGGAAIGYMVWNKPHPKAEDQQAMTVNADVLYTTFSTDEQKANATYLNHVLEVSGTVSELVKNQDGKTVATLATEDPMGGIQCTFRDEVSVKTGDVIKVKGFCNGYTLSVLLNDCVLEGK